MSAAGSVARGANLAEVIGDPDAWREGVVRRATPVIKGFEGYVAGPYLCDANYWTIGYGNRFYEDGREVRPTDARISALRAEALLLFTLRTVYLPALMRQCPNLRSPRRATAMLSFVYNLGEENLRTSTLRRKVNAEDWPGAAKELLRWKFAGGVENRGLLRRRQVEATMLLMPGR